MTVSVRCGRERSSYSCDGRLLDEKRGSVKDHGRHRRHALIQGIALVGGRRRVQQRFGDLLELATEGQRTDGMELMVGKAY